MTRVRGLQWPVPAGEWHTLEIPLEQFTNADLSTVTGFIVTSVNYIEELDADGNPVVDENGEPSILDAPSRETIYMDEVYFASVPDAPRSTVELDLHDDGDVAAVFSDDYSVVSGSSFPGGVVEQVSGQSVLLSANAPEAKIVNASGINVPAAPGRVTVDDARQRLVVGRGSRWELQHHYW